MIQHPSLRPPSPTTNPPNDDDNISFHSDDVKSPFTTLVKAPSNIEVSFFFGEKHCVVIFF